MNETARDLIAPDNGEVHLWHIAVNMVDISASEQTLDMAELERTDKFRFPEDACRYRAARHLQRTVLSSYLRCGPREIAYEQGEYGKPVLKYPAGSGLKFNMSRSGDLAVVAVARKEVGIDVERMKPKAPTGEIAQSFFSPTERAHLETLPRAERAKAFYRLWTRKEALLKATGEGLNGLSPNVDILTGSVFARRGRKWHLLDFNPGEGYAGALAIECECFDVKHMDWDKNWMGHKN